MNPPLGFADSVRAALLNAGRIYAGTSGESTVANIASRMDEALRVAIAGQVKAGKSTLLNALVGDELSPTDAAECTRVVWWFHDGITYRATVHPNSGPRAPSASPRHDGAIEVDLDGIASTDVERLEIEWPSKALRSITLIDTPGIASATPAIARAAEDFFAPDEGRTTDADAVVYLMRHLHAADVRFLESFHSDEHVEQATPINTIAVLSRADELGVGRVDAMDAANRIAERYRRDRKLRRVSQAVVPIAGLLAQAAVTLREGDYRLLRQLHDVPAAELDELLLSVDRFCLRPSSIPPGERAALLRRFGIFGVRVALRFIGEGMGQSATSLANALLDESGLEQLRELLASQFTARRDLLKGRAALLALDALVQQMPIAGSDAIGTEVERIRASAHELAEIRLLNALRAGAVRLTEDEVAEAERLLGAEGPGVNARLGLDPNAEATVLAQVLSEALARWQRRAESPLAPADSVEAAEVVIRTCEALVAALGAGRSIR